MSTAKYLMQARDSIAGLITWTTDLPDWAAAHVTPTGTLDTTSIALSGGGFETPDSIPDKSITLTDGSYVVLSDGSYAVTT